MAGLKTEIDQSVPFASAEEEALLNLVRTADRLSRAIQRTIRPWGITATQYNVLRILRGAGPEGLTCSEIGGRMITEDPDITRLLRRLKALKLIRQHHDRRDRRVVRTQISDAGLQLLDEMDPAVKRAPQELLGHLSENEIAELTRLLELVRAPCAGVEAGDEIDSKASSKNRS